MEELHITRKACVTRKKWKSLWKILTGVFSSVIISHLQKKHYFMEQTLHPQASEYQCMNQINYHFDA